MNFHFSCDDNVTSFELYTSDLDVCERFLLFLKDFSSDRVPVHVDMDLLNSCKGD